ncbi:MAG: bifunctional 5,10-methylenetetrahydrofolate dehydrogenase/5,10-methenyltetrahydrofolate cyclohydrolase [Patescibacteria group bacterium]
MIVIDGKKIAGEIIADLKKRPAPQKELAAILVGENSASASFLRQKEKIAKELGVSFRLYNLSSDFSEGELIAELTKLISGDQVGGFILQLPLPVKYDRASVLAALSSGKDVDALTGKSKAVPPAVLAVQDVLKEVNYSVTDKVVGVVGRGLLVGRPIAEYFTGKCREVIIFHTKTDLSRIADCDLVICGAGKAGLIKPEMLKAGAEVIDFGFAVVDGKISGDFDAKALEAGHWSLGFYTPTPGGTGPILVAELFKNFYNMVSDGISNAR